MLQLEKEQKKKREKKCKIKIIWILNRFWEKKIIYYF